jgi:ABC-type uncharacterized transport system involved in gliding motility auxiliary subunit
MSKNMLTGAGLGLAVLLFFAVNVFSNVALKSARIDLTDQQLYTLSEGTKKILGGIEEPLTLRLYYSKKLATNLPGINSYGQRVQELLEEFEQRAKGNLTLHVVDPEPFSEEEDRAVGYGLQGVPLDSNNTQFYFGLAGASSTDETETIPFFQLEREEFLEYDLAKLVYQLANPKQKIVGLINSLPMDGSPGNPFMQGGGGQPWLIMDQIRQLLTVRNLEKDVTTIPEEVDVLMIVHPKQLSDPTLYAIDQFVLRGGRALVFVDPHSEADTGGGNPMNPMGGQGPKNSDLPKLFKAWGIQLVSGKVVGDLPLAKKVNFQKQSRMRVADYPIWMDLPPSYLNNEDIVTSQLPNLTMASAGAIQTKEGSETTVIPLVETDEKAMLIDASRIQFLPDVESLLKSYLPANEKYTLAARVTGTVKSAFPDGKPKGKEEEREKEEGSETASEKPHLSESVEPINVIVVADTDLLQDRFWVQVQSFLGQRIGIPSAANGSFVTNALDNLTGSNDLISIRNRGSFTRPFTLVKAIQQEAEQQYRQKEQLLQERLRSTERKIQELQSDKKDKTALILSPEQQKEIDRFRQELLSTRKELRSVQHELRKNIEGLEGTLKFVNIGLMPIVIGIGGVFFGLGRARRQKNAKAS